VRVRAGTAGSNPAAAEGFDYLGSLTYTSNQAGVLSLESVNFAGGVIRMTGNSGSGGSGGGGAQEVNYFLTDHLGSVRAIVDATGAVKERNDYYSFGAKHVRSDHPQSDNRFKYNGKELQITGDLPYLDYGARKYDSRTGRWFGVDPLTEKYCDITPYHFCSNNPVNRIDLDGRDDFYFNTVGKLMFYMATNAADRVFMPTGETYKQQLLSTSINVPIYGEVSMSSGQIHQMMNDNGYKSAIKERVALVSEMMKLSSEPHTPILLPEEPKILEVYSSKSMFVPKDYFDNGFKVSVIEFKGIELGSGLVSYTEYRVEFHNNFEYVPRSELSNKNNMTVLDIVNFLLGLAGNAIQK
jgi:RHS repeat-associated protein